MEDYFLKRYPLEYRSLEYLSPRGIIPRVPRDTALRRGSLLDEYPLDYYRLECPWNIMQIPGLTNRRIVYSRVSPGPVPPAKRRSRVRPR